MASTSLFADAPAEAVPARRSRAWIAAALGLGALAAAAYGAFAMKRSHERDAALSALHELHDAKAAAILVAEQYAGGFDALGPLGLNLATERAEVRGCLESVDRDLHALALPDWPEDGAPIRAARIAALQFVSLLREPRGSWLTYSQEMAQQRTAFENALIAAESSTAMDQAQKLGALTELEARQKWEKVLGTRTEDAAR